MRCMERGPVKGYRYENLGEAYLVSSLNVIRNEEEERASLRQSLFGEDAVPPHLCFV